jgi:hypothetical protein
MITIETKKVGRDTQVGFLRNTGWILVPGREKSTKIN